MSRSHSHRVDPLRRLMIELHRVHRWLGGSRDRLLDANPGNETRHAITNAITSAQEHLRDAVNCLGEASDNALDGWLRGDLADAPLETIQFAEAESGPADADPGLRSLLESADSWYFCPFSSGDDGHGGHCNETGFRTREELIAHLHEKHPEAIADRRHQVARERQIREAEAAGLGAFKRELGEIVEAAEESDADAAEPDDNGQADAAGNGNGHDNKPIAEMNAAEFADRLDRRLGRILELAEAGRFEAATR